jgi:hypothetical protein
MQTDVERQRKFRNKMYEAGFKPMQMWVKRKEQKYIYMNMTEFTKRFRKITKGWDSESGTPPIR